MQRSPNLQSNPKRRGAVVVLTAVMMVVLLGFAALTIDVGAMYNTKADLQDAADAAALAAAAALADYTGADPIALARQTAVDYVNRNPALTGRITIDPDTDVIFGRSEYNEATNTFTFAPSLMFPDSIRVRVRHAADSPNGSFKLFFASVFGKHSTEIAAEATALMAPRDIAVVADLSGSINFDSQLRSYKDTEINLYDVWAGLPTNGAVGGGGGPGGGPAPLDGPAWGYFREMGFGTEPIPSNYDPNADAGLVRLPYRSSWNNVNVDGYLAAQGYSQDEIDVINSANDDRRGGYPDRVAVGLGLAEWDSGIPGGRWEGLARAAGGGDGNGRIGGAELLWSETVFDRTAAVSRDIWRDYTNNYVRSSRSYMARANRDFQYQYGIKTFVDFLMARYNSAEQAPELADTPAQPMQAVKDAVDYMTWLLTDLATNDQLALEVYASNGMHEVDLTRDFQSVDVRMKQMQAAHYKGIYTNMGGGMQRAIEELTGVRARTAARKVMVLMTDGNANVDVDGKFDYTGGGEHALIMAQEAANQGIRVFAVSVGIGANQTLMQQIADIGGGEHFHAEGTIDQYSAQLGNIFLQITGRRGVELVQ